MIRLKFGEIISAKKIRQIDISHDTGISRNTLSALTNNSTDMIRLETVDLLCSHLGITPCEFFEYYPGDIKITVGTSYIDEVMEYAVEALVSVHTKEKVFKASFKGFFEPDEGRSEQTGEKSLRGKLEIDKNEGFNEWRVFAFGELSHGLQSEIVDRIEKEVISEFEKTHGYRSKNIKISSISIF